MNLAEIVSQEKFYKYRMDDVDEFEDSVCFVQVNKKREVFPDYAVVMWDGYFYFFQEYLLKKETSGIIAALDEAMIWDDEYGSKDIGYVTNLEKELEYLVEAKGNLGIKDSEDMEANGFYDEESEQMVEELRLEMIKLFEDAIKKGNQIVYLLERDACQFVES